MRVVGWANSFEREHFHIRDVVPRQIKMSPSRGVLFLLGYTAPVFIETVLCSPLSFSKVHPVCTLFAPQFVNYISRITVEWGGYIPCFACSGAFMTCNSNVTACAHHTLFSYKIALPESKLLPLGPPIQRHLGPDQHVLKVLVPLVTD